jgi:phosphoenolpyruvate-protein kinase (PTS system EI component)
MPATTLDGRTITVLVNVAGAAELGAGLAAGAEGVGLLRTELAFLDAERWPSEQEHFDSVNSTLAGIAGRRAVVRVLDFGADKAPSFLHGIAERGIGLLLAHEEAFLAQLRAIIRCSREHEIELLLPMIEHAEEVLRTQQLLRRAAAEVGTTAPPLGCMIETPLAAASAAGIAAYSAFLSIGTNDLTASTLGADRFNGGAALTHDPRVLAQIDRAVVAAHAAGIPIEVCGEAASEPVMLPLLVGLGVDELSVGAAQVGVVRERIRGLSFAESSELARRALKLSSAEEVERSVDAILAAQVGL